MGLGVTISIPIGSLKQPIRVILSELSTGGPVLVLHNLGLASYPVWHYAVVTGFDASRNEIILRPGEMPVAPDETRYVHAVAALESAAQPDAAAAFYAKALSRWPDNTLALFGTGNIYYAQGNKKAAEATCQRLLAIRLDHGSAPFFNRRATPGGASRGRGQSQVMLR